MSRLALYFLGPLPVASDGEPVPIDRCEAQDEGRATLLEALEG